MFRKTKQLIFGKRKDIKPLLERIDDISQISSSIVIYGSPTEGNWLGIANATKGLFADNALEAPQYYSTSLLSSKETAIICNEIITKGFQKVIFSGFAPYFFLWIDLLSKHCAIEVLFHGTISEFHDKSKQEFVKNLIQYGKANKINRMGFVKVGLDQVFSQLYGFQTYHQPLATPTIPLEIEMLNLDKKQIHIGVFGADTFNKNLHNQVIHALLLENTIIHVLDKSIFAYLEKDSRIVEHGKNLTRNKFLSILKSMDLNLYMSYSESWGLVAYESEALGVPCILTPNIDYKKAILDWIEKKQA